MKKHLYWLLTLPLYLFFAAVGATCSRLPGWLHEWLRVRYTRHAVGNLPDFIIPPSGQPSIYMKRWWVIPRNGLFNIYLHDVKRSDDDRALHDHPWWNFSIILSGGYYEHTIEEGGINRRVWRSAGTMKFRRAGTKAHRLELHTDLGTSRTMPALTLFITGPVMRRWGFHDPNNGWVDAYEWDAHCERHGITTTRLEGGSDSSTSERNRL